MYKYEYNIKVSVFPMELYYTYIITFLWCPNLDLSLTVIRDVYESTLKCHHDTAKLRVFAKVSINNETN